MSIKARVQTAVRGVATGIIRRVLGALLVRPGQVTAARLEPWSGEVGSTIVHLEPLPRMASIHVELRRAPRGSYFYVHVPPERSARKPTEYMTPDEVVEMFVTKIYELTQKYAQVVISTPWLFGIWRIEEYRLKKELGTASGVNVEACKPRFGLESPGGS